MMERQNNETQLKCVQSWKHHRKRIIFWETLSCSTGLQQSNTGLCCIAFCFVVTSSPLNFKCPSVCRRKAENIICVRFEEDVKLTAFFFIICKVRRDLPQGGVSVCGSVVDDFELVFSFSNTLVLRR